MAVETPRTGHVTTGLTTAEVRARVSAGYVNVVERTTSRSTAEIIRSNVVTRFNILLSILLLIVLIVIREPADALFGIVMVTNAAIGIVQELQAKRTLDRLALLTTPTIHVRRDGTTIEIPIEQIVIDDLILLRSGDQIPVDGRVVEPRGLEADESLLTGESDPVLKEPDDIVLSGSFVAAGSGSFIATRIGEASYAAGLAEAARQFKQVKSELRDGVNWIIGAVSWVVGPVIVLLVWSAYEAGATLTEALSSGVAGAVAMIPQGLVLLTSIAFALGVSRLGKRNVLVQEPPAIEGLARVDVVCFDKTGTLTEGGLMVQELIALTDEDPAVALGALGAVDPAPNATNQAIIDRYPSPTHWHADAAVPFSSARKWSGASFGARGTWVVGAPDILAPDSVEVLATAERHSALGRRVLLLASSDLRIAADQLPRRLRPEALVVLGDRIRPDASDTLRYFAQQGVQAKVISGDYPATVSAIAREVGVPGSQNVVDGRDLPTDFDELAAVVDDNAVFGRVTPQQKRAMVRALQGRGHVVAMTGDGVNDVLALKDADIGLAMGGGSAAARAVSEMVLIDGSFATVPDIVGEGRRVIANIERVANLFVTKTVYAILLTVAVGLVGRQFPFLPRHLTLVGSLTIGIPAFFLALAPNAARARPGFLKRVLRFSIPVGIAAGAATFAAYELANTEGETLQQARTEATLVLAAIGLFAVAMVALPLNTWKKWLIASMASLLLAVVLFPPTREFFDLSMPRPAVLFAGAGIVAITGALMFGTLRAVGWVRQVPELFRDGPPPEASRFWAQVKEQSAVLLTRGPQGPDDEAFTGTERLPPVTDTPPPAPYREIEWFNPDLDPVDYLNEAPAPDSLESDPPA
jgi:cation-transporting ATPase E